MNRKIKTEYTKIFLSIGSFCYHELMIKNGIFKKLHSPLSTIFRVFVCSFVLVSLFGTFHNVNATFVSGEGNSASVYNDNNTGNTPVNSPTPSSSVFASPSPTTSGQPTSDNIKSALTKTTSQNNKSSFNWLLWPIGLVVVILAVIAVLLIGKRRKN